MELKTLVLAELKIAGDETGSGSFTGRASTFGTIDSYGDTVDPGAYKETIPQFLERGFIGWGHNWENPIGIVTDAKEAKDGLYITGEFHSDPEAQMVRTRARERVAAGKFMGLSIGYEAREWEMREIKDSAERVRALTKIHLFEVSLVTVPAEQHSGLTAIKGFGLPFDVHSDNVRVAVAEWLERARSGSDSRFKEGRPISEARRKRMAAVKDSLLAGVAEIEALLNETEPRDKELPPPDAEVVATQVEKAVDPILAELHARFLELDAMHRAAAV